jgi:hypothetical protein
MSHSTLFKKIISKKVQNKYVFVLYKNKFNNKSSVSTPLQVCTNSYETSFFILNYYINELYKTKTIISQQLFKLLNSKKSIQTKINAIILEYNNLFGPNNKEDYYSINNFTFQLLPQKHILLHKIIKKQIKHNKYFIKYTLHDYKIFYNLLNYMYPNNFTK